MFDFVRDKRDGSYAFLPKDGIKKYAFLLKGGIKKDVTSSWFMNLDISPNYIDKYTYKFLKNRKEGSKVQDSSSLFSVQDFRLYNNLLFVRFNYSFFKAPVVFIFDKEGVVGYYFQLGSQKDVNYMDLFEKIRTNRDVFFIFPSVLIFDNFLVRNTGGPLFDKLPFVSLRMMPYAVQSDYSSFVAPDPELRGNFSPVSFAWLEDNKATNLSLVLKSVLRNEPEYRQAHVVSEFFYKGIIDVEKEDSRAHYSFLQNLFLFYNSEKKSLDVYGESFFKMLWLSIDMQNRKVSDYFVATFNEISDTIKGKSDSISNIPDFIFREKSIQDIEQLKTDDSYVLLFTKSSNSIEKVYSMLRIFDSLNFSSVTQFNNQINISSLKFFSADRSYKKKYFTDNFAEAIYKNPNSFTEDFFKGFAEAVEGKASLLNILSVCNHVMIDVPSVSFYDFDGSVFVFDSFMSSVDLSQLNSELHTSAYGTKLTSKLNLNVDIFYAQAFAYKRGKIVPFSEIKDVFSLPFPIFVYGDKAYLGVIAVRVPDGIRLVKFEYVYDPPMGCLNLSTRASSSVYKDYKDAVSSLDSHSVSWDKSSLTFETFVTGYPRTAVVSRNVDFSKEITVYILSFWDRLREALNDHSKSLVNSEQHNVEQR